VGKKKNSTVTEHECNTLSEAALPLPHMSLTLRCLKPQENRGHCSKLVSRNHSLDLRKEGCVLSTFIEWAKGKILLAANAWPMF